MRKIRFHKSKHKGKVQSHLHEVSALFRASRKASLGALAESKALGINVLLLEGDKIVELQPNGLKVVKGKISKNKRVLSSLYKGMTLNIK